MLLTFLYVALCEEKLPLSSPKALLKLPLPSYMHTYTLLPLGFLYKNSFIGIPFRKKTEGRKTEGRLEEY